MVFWEKKPAVFLDRFDITVTKDVLMKLSTLSGEGKVFSSNRRNQITELRCLRKITGIPL